ncbi:disks large-associated protein 5-like isoform X2 [Diprion similis]|uniref:disks large-associated protein 5-like isoform X2 n=1 Tax=Diprion similis TaxID=362088 RepID=UPI001EF88C06|nr:disks large-associated protein 5-like isoform X2 [Diprion similis]
MADLRTHYKKKAVGFGNLEESRIIRAAEQVNARKQRRSAVHAVNRKIIGSDEPKDQNVQEDRRMKLLRWRAERDLQKKIQKAMKPPVFRVGVCHHKLNSPIFLHQNLPATKPVKSSIPPRITRATSKRLASKASMKAHTPEAGIVLRNKKPITKVFGQRNVNKSVKSVGKTDIPDSSFAPDNHEFKPPTGLPSLPLFGQAALEGPKQNHDTTVTPVFFSPYIVNAKKKEALRQKQLQQSNTTTDSVLKQSESDVSLTASVFEKDEERTTSYFRRVTDGEVMRLKALCWDWMMIKSAPGTPEDAQLMINQAIGQTNLLIDKKVKQFRKLIAQCETGSGEKLVTCDDLQGFWDMVYMQVEDCDCRFAKLNQLKERNWQETEQKKIKAKKIVAPKPPVAATKKNGPSKPSSIREMILAARRMKIESQANQNSPAVTISESSKPCVESLCLPTIKFDGGFFMVESPKKIITPRNLQKSTPLPHSKFSGESKHRRSALKSIGVSQMLKPLEIESEPLIPFSTFQQTPGKSILKQTETHKSASCTTRSQNKVNFVGDGEIFTKSNNPLGKESSTIILDTESINTKQEAELDVKKRLDFLSLDSSDSDSETQYTKKTLEQNSSELSCNDEAVSREHENLQTLEDGKIVKIERNGFSDSVIVSKNSVNLARVTRTTRQSALKKLTKRMELDNSNIHSNIAETPYDRETSKLQKENKKPGSPESTKLRRSARRSVRFTGEECTVCSSLEQVRPMTPHVKRRTSKSSERRKSYK